MMLLRIVLALGLTLARAMLSRPLREKNNY